MIRPRPSSAGARRPGSKATGGVAGSLGQSDTDECELLLARFWRRNSVYMDVLLPGLVRMLASGIMLYKDSYVFGSAERATRRRKSLGEAVRQLRRIRASVSSGQAALTNGQRGTPPPSSKPTEADSVAEQHILAHCELDRRRLHNEIQDLKGAVRVYARIRPLLPREEFSDADGRRKRYCLQARDVWDDVKQGAACLAVKRAGFDEPEEVDPSAARGKAGNTSATEKQPPNPAGGLQNSTAVQEFEFDAVFGPRSTQSEVFCECRDLVQSALDGYNVCIFTYGQTGAGKTYTLLGPACANVLAAQSQERAGADDRGGGPLNIAAEEDEEGVAPRTIRLVFEALQRNPGAYRGCRVFVTMCELYNAKLCDLLVGFAGRPPTDTAGRGRAASTERRASSAEQQRRGSIGRGAPGGGAAASSSTTRVPSPAASSVMVGAAGSHLGAVDSSNLIVKFSPRSGTVRVPGATEIEAGSREALLQELRVSELVQTSAPQILGYGIQRRRTAATRANADSSRSHLVLTLHLRRGVIGAAGASQQAAPLSAAGGQQPGRVSSKQGAGGVSAATAAPLQPQQMTTLGKITLCDLAGSERLKKAGSTGDAQKEAIEINKSLSALGDVLQALTSSASAPNSSQADDHRLQLSSSASSLESLENALPGGRAVTADSTPQPGTFVVPVPYRNHKLTQLMQDSLGGSAKTLMFVNLNPSPDAVDESTMSLRFASRARQIRQKAASIVNKPA